MDQRSMGLHPQQGNDMKFNIKDAQTGRIKVDHLLPDYGCEWSPWGVLQRMPTFIYHKPIYPDYPDWDITWELGRIKLRTDGRWSWWRQLSPHWPVWRAGEGVALTKMGAIFNVQEGWIPQEHVELFPTIEPPTVADVYEYSSRLNGDRAWWERHIVLGRVIDTHTGVWIWVRHKSKLHPEWKPGRGTSRSCHLAHQNLMDGWE